LGVVRTFPPSLGFGEARRSAARGGGRSAVTARPKGLHYNIPRSASEIWSTRR
jgi:hypothetical protein